MAARRIVARERVAVRLDQVDLLEAVVRDVVVLDLRAGRRAEVNSLVAVREDVVAADDHAGRVRDVDAVSGPVLDRAEPAVSGRDAVLEHDARRVRDVVTPPEAAHGAVLDRGVPDRAGRGPGADAELLALGV